MIKHGDRQAGKRNRLYEIWAAMKRRCYGINSFAYKNYGGRGIGVCEKWQEYEKFKKWALSCGYKKELTIDRINNNKGYEPENCQWISKSENTRKAQQKLTLTQAILIRKLYLNAKISQRKFAKWINMPSRTFSDLITKKTYIERG